MMIWPFTAHCRHVDVIECGRPAGPGIGYYDEIAERAFCPDHAGPLAWHESDVRAYYIRAYARLDEMVRLHSLGLGSTELLHAQREVIARELREALARD